MTGLWSGLTTTASALPAWNSQSSVRTATGRELLDFIWAIGRTVEADPQRSLVARG
jgi:hypothetical protein